MHQNRLLSYILKRIFYMILFFVVVSLTGFLFLKYTPGSQKQLQFGMLANSDSSAAVSSQLDETSYTKWAFDFVKGNLGVTSGTGQEIAALMRPRLVTTLFVSFVSWALALICSVVLAVTFVLVSRKSKKQNRIALFFYKVIEIILLGFTPLTLTMALFFILQKFNIYIGYLQNSVYKQFFAIVMLFLLQIPYYRRLMSKLLQQAIARPYSLYALSLGYSYRRLLVNHLLPNTVSYVLHFAHIQFSFLLGASIIVEYVLGIQGIGSLISLAVIKRERQLAIALLLVVACMVFLYREIAEAIRYSFEKRSASYV